MELYYFIHWTPIQDAAHCGKIDIVKLLLKQPDIDVNSRGNGLLIYLYGILSFFYCTPLHRATSRDHADIVKLLLRYPKINREPKDNVLISSYSFFNHINGI